MDNAAFHKSEKSKTLITQTGCRILFLPPYSPDLNPIEQFWTYLKNKIKNIINRFNSLSQTIDYTFSIDQLEIK